MAEIETKDFVLATRSVNGIVVNSIGIINSVCPEGALVYFFGKNEVVRAPFDALSVIDVDKTGKGYVANSLRGCESELHATLEDWILAGIQLGHTLPVISP